MQRSSGLPQALPLLQVWDMLMLESLHDKYLRPVGVREAKRVYAKVVVACAAGDLPVTWTFTDTVAHADSASWRLTRPPAPRLLPPQLAARHRRH